MILVTGAGGMLGSDLLAELGDRGRGVDLIDMDITSAEDVERVLTTVRPRVVVNCAAYTDVDGCETNLETAMLVNGTSLSHLAAATIKIGAKLVQISTDYVFDGCKGTPCLEGDPTAPLSIYGKSKLLGENNTMFNPNHLIVRTQWLYGLHGNNFVETMLRLASERDSLSVVNDQIGSPTWTVELSKAIIALIDHDCRGIYHAAGSGCCSWNDFAAAIFEEASIQIKLSAMTTDQLNRPARRPLYSVLDCSKLVADSGFRFQPWREALRFYLSLR